MGIQKVIRGRDSLKKLPQMLDKLGFSRPMIVGGETLTAALLRKNPGMLGAPVFSGFHPNPDLADAELAAEAFRKSGCDGVISIGGGSAMDTAKAMLAILAAGSADAAAAGNLPDQMPAPHIAIPGTAGSGSEATPNAVVYLDGRKLSLRSPGLKPDGVLLDAALLETLPEYQKKSCALDALCQGIESWWAKGATDDSRVNAYLAVLGVLDNLKAYLAGDPHAAEEMLDASFQSGKAIAVSRTTAAHAMSYQITKRMGLAHGHACMLTLPVLWDQLLGVEEMKEPMRELAAMMHLGDPQMGSKLLKGLLYDLEMEIPPMPDEETLNALADSVNQERLSNHPVPLTREEIKRIYRLAFAKPNPMEKQACLDIWRYYGR